MMFSVLDTSFPLRKRLRGESLVSAQQAVAARVANYQRKLVSSLNFGDPF